MKATQLKQTAKATLMFALFFTMSNVVSAQTRVDTSGGDFYQLKAWMIKIVNGLLAIWFLYMIGAGIFKLNAEDSGGRGLRMIIIGAVGLIIWKLAHTFLVQLAA